MDRFAPVWRRFAARRAYCVRVWLALLAIFLESSGPIAITRHGETIGFYIPARPGRKEEQLEALRTAAERLDELIAGSGASEDELVSDFKESRRRRRKAQR